MSLDSISLSFLGKMTFLVSMETLWKCYQYFWSKPLMLYPVGIISSCWKSEALSFKLGKVLFKCILFLLKVRFLMVSQEEGKDVKLMVELKVGDGFRDTLARE